MMDDVVSMPIDAFVSMSHYASHVLPVVAALPEDRRGHLYTTAIDSATRTHMRTMFPSARHTNPPEARSAILTAGFQDFCGRRPHVLISHGAGQVYRNVENPSYEGGPGREHIGLFLCPSERAAKLNRDRYQGAIACAVGSPKLDGWMRVPAPENQTLTVGVAFHWPAALHVDLADGTREMVVESGWAFTDWREPIAALARTDGIEVLGHGHPRARTQMTNYWASVRVEAVWEGRELLRRCDVLVADNTSLAYEFAAVGRPVVLLNAASWRRDVEHGLRFWSAMPGPDVWPDQGLAGILEAIDVAVTPAWHDRRAEITQAVYGPVDGHAAQRAVAAILEWEHAGYPHHQSYAKAARPYGC